MKHIKLFENYFLNEGRGNTRIRFEGVDYPTYYVDYYGEDEENLEGDTNEMFLDDVKGNISSFKTVKLEELDKEKWLNNDQAVYFENDIIRVVFADNENSMAVGCIPVFSWNDEDEETYDEKKFKEETTKFFTELLSVYKLRKATSAWTSTEVDKIEIK